MPGKAHTAQWSRIARDTESTNINEDSAPVCFAAKTPHKHVPLISIAQYVTCMTPKPLPKYKPPHDPLSSLVVRIS